MQRPSTLDLTILQGATFYRRVTWRTGQSNGDKFPVDLTGASARMQARYNARASEVLIDLSTDNGGIVIEDALGGTFSLNLTAEQTDALTFPIAVYDLEITIPTTGTHRLLEGSITVDPQVTR